MAGCLSLLTEPTSVLAALAAIQPPVPPARYFSLGAANTLSRSSGNWKASATRVM